MFVFLMALGADYNMLVMTRIREESRGSPDPRGREDAIGGTGPTVTTAGLVLAGSFAVLGLVGGSGPGGSQIEAIGFGLATGILMDTFVVRVLLVPRPLRCWGDGTGGPRASDASTTRIPPSPATRPRRRRGPEGPSMRPWTMELAGRLEAARARVRRPPGQPPRRPGGPPGLGLPAPRLRRLGPAPSRRLRPPGIRRLRHPLGAPRHARADDARAHRRRLRRGAAPCLVVYVDAWTRLGGSQFLDSAGTGRYHTYLCEDVVGFVDAEYRTIPDAAHRALVGHSSGGYGALVTAMLRPDLFSACASLAGDCLFELSLLPDLARARRALRDRYDGSYERFFVDLGTRAAMSRGRRLSPS